MSGQPQLRRTTESSAGSRRAGSPAARGNTASPGRPGSSGAAPGTALSLRAGVALTRCSQLTLPLPAGSGSRLASRSPLSGTGAGPGEGCASPDLVAPAAGRRYGAPRERRGGGRGSRAGPASPRLAAAAVAAPRRLASPRSPPLSSPPLARRTSPRLASPRLAARCRGGAALLPARPRPAPPLRLREGRGEPHAPPQRGGGVRAGAAAGVRCRVSRRPAPR